MAEQLEKPFTTASPLLVNYNFADIANGTGYVTYYLIESEDSVGKDYHLTPQTDFSAAATLQQGIGATTDLDYDLTPFVISKTIQGTALLSVPIGGPGRPTVNASLYKVAIGGAETIIGSEISSREYNNEVEMIYLELPVPQTVFEVGEGLRLRMRVVNGSGSVISLYGQDPAGRADATLTITSQSKIKIPEKLDL